MRDQGIENHTQELMSGLAGDWNKCAGSALGWAKNGGENKTLPEMNSRTGCTIF